MTKNRVEALTDGVVAIAITVMVLELKAPAATSLQALLDTVPEFGTYLLSFVLVGIYWNNHHNMFHAVKHISGKVLWANLSLLFWLSLLPFATEWLRNSGFTGIPVGFYGFILLMAAVAYTILTQILLKIHGEDSDFARALGPDTKGKVSLGLYLLALLVFYWAPLVACGLYVLVAAIWFIPDPRFAPAVKS